MSSDAPQGLSAVVELRDGRPTALIDGEVVAPIMYGLSDIPGARSWKEQPARNIRLFAEQGVAFVQADVCLCHCWTGPGQFDIEPTRREVAGVLAASPEALVMLRVHVNPPYWWMKAHPEELVVYADGPAEDQGEQERLIGGDMDRVMRVSLASEVWLREVGEMLAAWCEQLAGTPEGSRVVGIQPACGAYGEWHYWGCDNKHEPDYGPAMTARFRRRLAAKYGTDARLREAWGDASASIDTATIPDTEARLRATDGAMRDPRCERAVIDSLKNMQGSVADAILHFCRIAKENWPRPVIAGAFYGYFFNIMSRAAVGGHLEVERVLNSPWVDYLSAPHSYLAENRDMGGAGHSRGLLESARLHGKLWLTEMDERPIGLEEHLAGGDPARHPEAIAIMRRCAMDPLSRGMGFWYYDHRIVPNGDLYVKYGWWDHPTLLAEVRRHRELFHAFSTRPFAPVADVALVFDTDAYYHTACKRQTNVLHHATIDGLLTRVAHSGVAFDSLYAFDLDRVDWSRYKAVVFANAYHIAPERRRLIKERIATDGRHLIWLYASGYSDGSRLSTDLIADAIGISVARTSDHRTMTIDGCGLPGATSEAPRVPVPLFAVDDPDAETAARFGESADIAAARKRLPAATSWFFALPPNDSATFRALFRQAGAHVYLDSPDALIAGPDLVAIHTAEGGDRRLCFRNGTELDLALPPRSTSVFDARTGEAVLA